MEQRAGTQQVVREILDEQGCGEMGERIADVIAAVAEGRDTDATYRALVAQDDAEWTAFLADC